jgi:tRNA pseudouridine38-40 synthase
MALRRADGFVRYALSLQYHGAAFLGFSYQGKGGEDCILPDGTDMRGYRSVEGHIREALNDLVGEDKYENMQVSSRTDRGVHALKNTFHVDILQNQQSDADRFLLKLRHGLNYYLSRQTTLWDRVPRNSSRGQQSSHAIQLSIVSASKAPDFMVNPFHIEDPSQPETVDWNARFSSTQRTYVYRILYFSGGHDGGAPFEWDRSWRLRGNNEFKVDEMNEAASFLEGNHDFSAFRAAHCKRVSPIVTMRNVSVHSQPYGESLLWDASGGLLGLGTGSTDAQLVTIKVVGDSFLYRQVRNMAGCLAEVGRGKLQPAQVRDILEAKKRSASPGTAPPQGLFLADVKHGKFII